jgi:hypothetical protein
MPLNLATAEGRAKQAELKTAAIRLRSFGATMSTIMDKLELGAEEDAESLVTEGLREVMADDADMVRAKQQATLNDIRRAMYPGVAAGDQGAAGVVLKVLDHEAKLHGILAPQRVAVGLDQETFTTRVEEDIRELGIDPKMDVPLDEGDGSWANT